MAIDIKSENSLKQPIIIFCLISVFVILGSYALFVKQENVIKGEENNDLLTVSELKASQIERWRDERLQDAEGLMFEYVEMAHAGKNKLLTGTRMLSSERSLLHHGSEYKDIYVVDKELRVQTSAAGKPEILGSHAIALAKEAMLSKKIIFGDLQKNEKTGEIDLDICAPVVFPGNDTASGAIVLIIDPYKYLYPLLRSGYINDKTFETLLVEKEGDKVIFLNEAKFSKNAPLALAYSMDKANMPSVMSANNIEGVVQGRSYSGNNVLAVIKKITDSNWRVISQIDETEIYAEIRGRALLVFVVTLMFLLASGSLVGFVWHRQEAGFYKELYNASVERKAITSHYKYLLQYANDIIILFNKDLKIVEVNESALKAYGYTQDEIIKKTAKDLRADETLATLQNEFEELKKHGSFVFNTVHKRKDGTTFPVEISTRVIVIEWQEFYQSIIRDISGRKA
jgi:PAS domain S-box-containing protein